MRSITVIILLFLIVLGFFWFKPGKKQTTLDPFFDGPDKALAQNLDMIMDRQEGRVPYERLEHVRKLMAQARVSAEDRDFKWKSWDSKTPGRARMFYLHPSTGVLFSGSATGGLWKNTDYKNNARWEWVDGFQGASVNCIAADPNDPNTLYIGTGESFTAIINYRESTGIGNGIYKSTDGGATWSHLASTENFYFVNDLIVRNESGVSVLYAAVGSGTYHGKEFIQEGLYQTKDDGVNWSQVLPNLSADEGYVVSDLELGSNNRIFAGTGRNIHDEGGGAIFYSDDGVNWNSYSGFSTTVPAGWYAGRTIVKVAPANPNRVYALFTKGFYNALGQLRDYVVNLKQSTDGGSTWNYLPLPSGWSNIPWHALSLAVDPVTENKIVIGALDTYVLNNTDAAAITNLDWIKLSRWEIMDPSYTPEYQALNKTHYVHGDIHNIQFVNNNPDEVLITSDGALFYSENMTITTSIIDPENPSPDLLPVFKQPNNALNTTQYYYARLHPQKGIMEAVGGAQDNGCIYNATLTQSLETMISGGDGGYCFWDRDNTNLKITTVYGNQYYIHYNGQVYNNSSPVNGLFVNPMDYDDQSNLIYSNAATSSYGGLYPELKNRFFDTLEIANVNSFIGTNDLGLPSFSYVKLNANLEEAITAIKLSSSSSSSNKTAIIGTENGKVFKVKGLPFAANTQRIDNGQLPIGYISSVDVSSSENDILVTISNFGLPSVWMTRNGGTTWTNLERNLPDMPVRWGVFNPFDDRKILIATEIGIWGLENTTDELEEWKSYNLGLPQVRVDMIDIRKSDSTILAATHGHGFWSGKINQGDYVTAITQPEKQQQSWIFPNPATTFATIIPEVSVHQVSIRNMQGKLVTRVTVEGNRINLADLTSGQYFVDAIKADGKSLPTQKLIVVK